MVMTHALVNFSLSPRLSVCGYRRAKDGKLHVQVLYVSVIMCIVVWIHVHCMCSFTHSCGCVVDGKDAMAAF